MSKGIQIKCGWFKMTTIVKIYFIVKKNPTISTCPGCCPLLMSYFLETVKKNVKTVSSFGKGILKKN